jgi:hypothetical protein
LGQTSMPGRLRLLAILTLSMVLGGAIAGAPVGAHVGGSVNHLWGHLRPKADARYVNESESLFAVVNSDGSLARGSAVSSVAVGSTGVKRVYFTRNVSGCAFTATIGLASNVGTENPGFITVVGTAANGPLGEPNVRGVFVSTFDTGGAPANRGFHLKVDCANVANPASEVGARIQPADRKGGQNTR